MRDSQVERDTCTNALGMARGDDLPSIESIWETESNTVINLSPEPQNSPGSATLNYTLDHVSSRLSPERTASGESVHIKVSRYCI